MKLARARWNVIWTVIAVLLAVVIKQGVEQMSGIRLLSSERNHPKGIAIGARSDVVVETADVILVRSSPLNVVAINARPLRWKN